MIMLYYWLAWLVLDLVALRMTHPDSYMRQVVVAAFIGDLACYAFTALILMLPAAPEVPYE